MTAQHADRIIDAFLRARARRHTLLVRKWLAELRRQPRRVVPAGMNRHVLTRLRAERGMSQRELSERAGVSREFINRLETGYLKPPVTASNVAALAWALDVDILRLADLVDIIPLGPK